MKRIIFGALIFSQPVIADEMCTSIEFLAKSAMEFRQKGVAMSTVINGFVEEGQPEAELYKTIIIEAYDSPRFSTEEYQKSEIIEFSNKWYSACLKSTR